MSRRSAAAAVGSGRGLGGAERRRGCVAVFVTTRRRVGVRGDGSAGVVGVGADGPTSPVAGAGACGAHLLFPLSHIYRPSLIPFIFFVSLSPSVSLLLIF
jgi:hypothetical protein